MPGECRAREAERKPAIDTLPEEGIAASERKVLWLLAGVIVFEGFPVVLTLVSKPDAFLRPLGFAPDAAGPWFSWALGAAVAIAYVWGCVAIPAVREHLIRPGLLKAVALLAAVMAAVLEEVIFRKWVMDYVERQGMGAVLQVLASGATFGLGHAVWGLLGGRKTAMLSMASTGVLGVALGIVYLAAGRSLAPCIASHFVITALIEPGLLVAAVSGQMRGATPHR